MADLRQVQLPDVVAALKATKIHSGDCPKAGPPGTEWWAAFFGADQECTRQPNGLSSVTRQVYEINTCPHAP